MKKRRMGSAGSIALLLAAAATAMLAQDAGPAVRILRPAAASVLVGRVEIEAAVASPPAAVRHVLFFADGREVCRVATLPYICAWDAGSRAQAHSLRVVADLASGERLVTTLRTSAPDVSRAVFSSAVDAITVPVRVRDGRGRPIGGLTVDRFQLAEDGVPQAVGSLTAESATPSLLLALDMSASMGPILPDVRRAAELFLDGVRGHQSVSVAVFNSALFMLAPPGMEAGARRASLGRLRPTGGTALFDSLVRAVEVIRTQPAPRAIVAFTDGEDLASVSTVDTVRSAVLGDNVALYLVIRAGTPPPGSTGAALADIAVKTGGAAWFTNRMSGLGERFREVVADLSTRYVLSYTPSRPLGDGAWRELRVSVAGADRDYQIEARQGYFAVERATGGR